MSGTASRRLALAALVALALMLTLPFDVAAALTALPIAVLLAAAWRPTPLWAVATASVMLVYFSYGVMEILTNPAGRMRAVLFSVLTVTVFLGALDSTRRP